MPRLLIAASGTGGHIFPALAVADALSDSWQISWLGVANRLEVKLLPSRYKLITVNAGAIQGKGLKKVFEFFQLLVAALRVWKLLHLNSIDVVFTTGGYIAAPAILGAKLCGIPVILHESNAFPGKVSRLLGRFCNKVAVGFSVASEKLPNCKTILTGTPVRKEFLLEQSLPSWVPLGPGPLILVMGGSQGAKGLNIAVRQALPLWLKEGFRIVHLTGKHKDYKSEIISHNNLVESSFSNEIPALIQHADVVISRAGAGTISELACCNVPAILIPFPSSSDKHQDYNAAFAAQLGAAVVIHQDLNDCTSLHSALMRILGRSKLNHDDSISFLKKMSQGMSNLFISDSEAKIVKLISSFVDL